MGLISLAVVIDGSNLRSLGWSAAAQGMTESTDVQNFTMAKEYIP
jgi:hypothetical protein